MSETNVSASPLEHNDPSVKKAITEVLLESRRQPSASRFTASVLSAEPGWTVLTLHDAEEDEEAPACVMSHEIAAWAVNDLGELEPLFSQDGGGSLLFASGIGRVLGIVPPNGFRPIPEAKSTIVTIDREAVA